MFLLPAGIPPVCPSHSCRQAAHRTHGSSSPPAPTEPRNRGISRTRRLTPLKILTGGITMVVSLHPKHTQQSYCVDYRLAQEKRWEINERDIYIVMSVKVLF